MLTDNTQLEKYTTPCPNKATNSLLSSSNLNTELMDARRDPKQQSLKMTRLESDNLIHTDNVFPPTQENLAAKWTTAQASENNDDIHNSHTRHLMMRQP